MNRKINVKECPKCGSKEIGLGRHTGPAIIYPVKRFGIGSDVEHVLCTDCGFIIESYVRKPDKFKGTMIKNLKHLL